MTYDLLGRHGEVVHQNHLGPRQPLLGDLPLRRRIDAAAADQNHREQANGLRCRPPATGHPPHALPSCARVSLFVGGHPLPFQGDLQRVGKLP
jgi:hypothetical protein